MKLTIKLASWLMLLSIFGCTRPTVESPPPSAARPPFDRSTCGTVAGRVVWTGDIPSVAPFAILPIAGGLEMQQGKQLRPNPNAPLIHPDNRGVGNAVVFLRGVDPARAKPWDHAPVKVTMVDHQFRPRYGFVRRGDAVTMVSQQNVRHGLRADGAAFFTLAFPDADRPLSRRLEEKGVVELSSSASWFWMRAYLFVDDHPYYAATAADGTYTLTDVPEGRYELVCWLPDWREAGRDLDPELGMVSRLRFHLPREIKQTIEVRCGETTPEYVRDELALNVSP